MRLTPHFTLEELAVTNHRHYVAENMARASEHLDSLRAVAAMLEAVRAHFGAPVIVHSGYRCPELNAAIGGSPTSQHQKGEAADFHVSGVANMDTWRWIWKESGLHFGQLIAEGHAAGKPTWIHLSLGAPWRSPTRCGEVMTWDATHGYHIVGRVP